MTGLGALIKRNTKLFFKDKGMFFTSLITPLILLVLYATFLADVYKDSFKMGLPEGLLLDGELLDGIVGAQLFSSLLAVCCVTVSFCSNMLMVQDKVSGARRDIIIAPVKGHAIAIAYYISTALTSLIICYVAMAVCLIYISFVGWYMALGDVLLLVLDVFLLVMFGTVLSSIVNYFLSSQGQISAVGTIVSSGYGFICGAYMPISQFGEGLQKVISFLPGTYGTSLLRNHAMRGAFEEMESVGFPQEIIDNMKNTVDCNLYFFESNVPLSVMYAILVGSIVALMAIYILINVLNGKKAK